MTFDEFDFDDDDNGAGEQRELFENPAKPRKKGKKKRAKRGAAKRGAAKKRGTARAKVGASANDPKTIVKRLKKVEGAVVDLAKFRAAQQVFNAISAPAINAVYTRFDLPPPEPGVLRGLMSGVIGGGRKAARR